MYYFSFKVACFFRGMFSLKSSYVTERFLESYGFQTQSPWTERVHNPRRKEDVVTRVTMIHCV